MQHHIDRSIGVYIIDRYTYYTLQFLEGNVAVQSNRTLQEYVRASRNARNDFQLDSCPHHLCLSTVGVRTDLYPKLASRVRVTDFFGSARHVKIIDAHVAVPDEWLM